MDRSNTRPGELEREFLLLAGVYLKCRWKAMGNEIIGDQIGGDLYMHLLGMVDYAYEMALVIRDANYRK